MSIPWRPKTDNAVSEHRCDVERLVDLSTSFWGLGGEASNGCEAGSVVWGFLLSYVAGFREAGGREGARGRVLGNVICSGCG